MPDNESKIKILYNILNGTCVYNTIYIYSMYCELEL